ncbi:MAG: hypothetical protein QF437_00520 [Planctomycetota bacterium]|jgi:hypothetical protein|nr:hypothetical protein [Planctomycetota bacterium]MDP7128941.1 hypothetical protein [Planctomycetota bacterium]MDP7251195.1 hypothetical protein [Planctomycetota bacterium]
MSFWIFLWKAVFIVGVVLFAGMAVWVTIGGAKDIKKMFAQMDKEREE